MNGISQTYETVTVPFSGELIGSGNNEDFTLLKGQVFSVEDGKAYYADADKGMHFILAQPFDSKVDKVMVGYLSGKVIPAQVTGSVVEGADLGLGANATLAAVTLGQPILAHVVIPQVKGLALVQTTFINTSEPEDGGGD